MKIKKPPHILVIHLKRFKYMEQLGRYKKLSYRVVFPLELKLSNTVEDADIEYSLFAVVVHVGSGPNHGHYVSLVKSHNHWLFFDDENVEMIDESAVQTFFGSSQEYSSNTDHGYILFYESLGSGNRNQMEEFYNSFVIIWTSFHQVSIFIFLSTVFPLFNLLGELLHPPEDSGCENLYLGWLACTVDSVQHCPIFFLLFLTIRTVYISGENFTNDVYSWLQTLNQHQKQKEIDPNQCQIILYFQFDELRLQAGILLRSSKHKQCFIKLKSQQLSTIPNKIYFCASLITRMHDIM